MDIHVERNLLVDTNLNVNNIFIIRGQLTQYKQNFYMTLPCQ